MSPGANSGANRLSSAIRGRPEPTRGGRRLVGLLPGEGVGPELSAAARRVLETVCERAGVELEIRCGPSAAAARRGEGVSTEAIAFCREVFAASGAVLAGPHGGRWVYELREELDLFCKLSPISSALTPAAAEAFEQVVIRDQAAGVYQGSWDRGAERGEPATASHSFGYSEAQVDRLLSVAIELASRRSGRLAVVVKAAGVPTISELWRQAAERLVATAAGVTLELVDIDYAAYRMVREPASLDVIAAPNLFGDVLSDLGGVRLGSRGMCFGANFDGRRAAVFQTNHGSAIELAGSDAANPSAHLLAAAMMLRESFGLGAEAEAVERALLATLAAGTRTPDLGGEAGQSEVVAGLIERLPAVFAAPAA